MEIIIVLFFHHLADVAFQPSWLITNKKTHPFAIYEHAFVWAGVVSIGLALVGRFQPIDFVSLLVVHWLIDYVKYQVLPKKYGDHYWYIYPDQFLHYLQVIVAFFL